MSRRISFLSVSLLGLAVLPLQAAQAGNSPLGVWLNDTGRGAIEIKECDGKLCGHVVWLRDQSDVKGCGRQIIGEASKAGETLWDNGWIYSPEKKRKYDVELKPLADGTLRVKGYAGTKFFSKTMIWTPAPADLKRCGETVAAVPAPSEAKPEAKVAVTEPAGSQSSPVIVKAPAVAVPAPAAEPKAAAEAPKTTEPARAPASSSKSEEKTAGAASSPAEPAPAKEADASGADKEDMAGAKDGLDIGKLADRLAELERETGYGLKKTGDGSCRLKVPFATITIRCEE